MLPRQFSPDDGAYGVDHILTGKIVGGGDLCLPGRFLIALLRHNLRALQTELYPGIGMDAVINAVVAGLVAAGQLRVSRIDDGPTFQGGNISTPEINSILNRMQVRQSGNLLRCQFSLQIGVLYIKKALADGPWMTDIHQ